jgi:MoxR-like ATPase
MIDLTSLNNTQLSTLVELTKPAETLGYSKSDMIRTLETQVDKELLIKAYEILINGIAYAPESPAAVVQTPGTVDVAVKDLVKSHITEIIGDDLTFQNQTIVVHDQQTIELKDEVFPEEFEQILQFAAQRLNVMLVGPAGCGKTHLAKKVAESFGLPFSSISITMGMSKSDLLGYLLPVGDGGKFEYVPSEFVIRYEQGGVFLLDEMDNADPNTLGIINQAIANGEFYLPQRLGNHLVKRHKDFICVAATNTFGTGADMMYVGRSQLDAATLDRFKASTVLMDYSDIVEKKLIDKELLRWAKKVRKNISKNQMQVILSTRVLLGFTQLMQSDNYSLQDCQEVFFRGLDQSDVDRLAA